MGNKSSQWITDNSPLLSGQDIPDRRIWWCYVLTLDEKNWLEQLMGMALLEPEIGERLLRHDASVLDYFHFSSATREWLLQIEAESLPEFAQALLSKLQEKVQVITTYKAADINITPELVRRATNKLCEVGESDCDNDLEELVAVSEFLANPYWPVSPLNRRLALQHLLVRLITDEFARQCWIFDIPQPEPNTSLDTALQTLRLIAQKGNPHLTGWAWLYYRYVCIDFDFSVKYFVSIVQLNERTMRRYQQNVFRELTEHLVMLEHQARLRLHTLSPDEKESPIRTLF